MKNKNEMVIYFADFQPSGKLLLHSCYHFDRHKIWKNYPHAREIPKKDFDKLVEIIKKRRLTSI